MTPPATLGSLVKGPKTAFPLVVMLALLGLAVANISLRATWQELEDGVLWVSGQGGVVAADVADGAPGARAGISRGDLLLAMDGQPVERVSDVVATLGRVSTRAPVRYTLLRLGTRSVRDVSVAPVPNGPRVLYFALAGVGLFTLLIGGLVRLWRPRDPATLHFFWLTVAFFGVFAFSFSGRLDRLDWVFYWADAVSILALPPLFLHFTRVFPERTRDTAVTRLLVPLAYLPAVALGLVHAVTMARSGAHPAESIRVLDVLDRLQVLYLSVCFVGGLATHLRALAEVRSITARRQLRWIAWGTGLGVTPFAVGYALPYAFGSDTTLPMQLSALPLGVIPLAYASAIVRYRLLDIEVIVKRALVYAAAVAAILTIYALLFQTAQRLWVPDDTQHNWTIALLATLVALLLAPPVKGAIQTALDRAFYRDRYDYRRALVGFARDVNADLDLARVTERLVARITETLAVDRMALMLGDEPATTFVSARDVGFVGRRPPVLEHDSELGRQLAAGHVVALDDPGVAARLAAEDIDRWRDAGLYYFVPCVVTDRLVGVFAIGRTRGGEPLNSEDMALLSAVAGHTATALENGRLFRQLQIKAGELDRVRAFNENIVQSLDDGLFVLDLDDRIARWTPPLEAMYGLSSGDAVGRTLQEVFPHAFVEAVKAARATRPDGATLSRIELAPVASAHRDPLTVHVTIVPLRAVERGASVGTIVIVEDVTRRVQLEEQLRLSERMASIGLLAAGVAHEVNTPLTGISSYTQMLLNGADPADARTRLLEKIEQQTFRAARIVNGLLNLARPGAVSGTEMTTCDCNTVVNDVVALLEHQFDLQRVKVRRELSPEPALVRGVEQKLQQVLLNLFLNAKDAMPRGGWLSLSTAVDGDDVVVTVADTGTGIQADVLDRIYDPFFTTKPIGRGTGLGLSIAYGIVREHEGTIECTSQAGQGTRFTIRLPRVEALPLARTGQ